MATESKDSSSVVNSVKRVLNDTAAKAMRWRDKFGEIVIPVALLSGVFGLNDLRSAQASGLYLVWAHDLDTLVEWLEGTHADRKMPHLIIFLLVCLAGLIVLMLI